MSVEKEVEIDSFNPHAPNHSIKEKLRLCLDTKDLNETIERDPYCSGTVNELIAKFSGAVVFTIVYMGRGYWQVELHSDSRKLICMALNIGRFQSKRHLMGTIIASGIKQKKMGSVYTGLPGVT